MLHISMLDDLASHLGIQFSAHRLNNTCNNHATKILIEIENKQQKSACHAPAKVFKLAIGRIHCNQFAYPWNRKGSSIAKPLFLVVVVVFFFIIITVLFSRAFCEFAMQKKIPFATVRTYAIRVWICVLMHICTQCVSFCKCWLCCRLCRCCCLFSHCIYSGTSAGFHNETCWLGWWKTTERLYEIVISIFYAMHRHVWPRGQK